ncbi:MAG: type sorting protein [Ferruginibacter sp.]|nr:type sorting protein [Ferruginibacter sp.]
MKKLLFTIFFSASFFCAFSAHISGGEMYYRYIGPGSLPNTLKYEITLRLFRDCSAGGANVAAMPTEVYISVFDNLGDKRLTDNLVNRDLTMDQHLQKMDFSCIQFAPEVCYDVGYFHFQVDLAKNAAGYTAAFQTCCRVGGINNIQYNFGSTNGAPGVTMSCKISGTDLLGQSGVNSSPVFRLKDTALVCSDNFFSLDFGAVDPDNDSLSFSLCSAYGCIGSILSATTTPSGPPSGTTFPLLTYTAGFTGSSPLGNGITINPVNGIISGNAPATSGRYVINVCIDEWRNGAIIGSHRKDFILKTADCNRTTAQLNPQYLSCDGFTLSFSNNATLISGTQYEWSFGDPASTIDNNSSVATPTHTYTDTGVYTLKLKVSLNGQCADSSSSKVKVYPGFFPGFRFAAPLCKGVPVQFTDTTATKYGVPTGWRWMFGDGATLADSSLAKNPTYIYPDTGSYQVQLIVGSTLGCVDTVTNFVKINDRPLINLRPHDTLICFIDTLQLITNNTGNFLWSPNYNISSLTAPSPLVSPDRSTTYFVTLTDAFGCASKDSVFVDVKTAVVINAGNDTTICRTDGMTLNTTSNALHYTWTPSTYLNSDTAKRPFANPLVASTTYKVVANIGKCRDSSKVTIKTLPYPVANAGRDTSVCSGLSAVLLATGGTSYQWSPATFLSAPNIANPMVIKPTVTTQYIVAVTSLAGCPKPAFDTVIVKVDPPVLANAGPSDTTVVLGEPLFLNGTGGAGYLWKPSTWLNNPTISNPVANPAENITYQLTVTSALGCQAMDSIRIKLYKVAPSFYVPTGFSPNGDGKNDFLKPILLGMRSLEYFRIFDRWGRVVFYTNQKGQGWDGSYKGSPQDPGTYVWMASGATFTGEMIVRKGYAVLIR